MAGTTGLEPATSAVTGQRSNQLSYVPNNEARSLVANFVERAIAFFQEAGRSNLLTAPNRVPTLAG